MRLEVSVGIRGDCLVLDVSFLGLKILGLRFLALYPIADILDRREICAGLFFVLLWSGFV